MAFDTTPQFWMNLQSNFDLWHEARTIEAKIIPFATDAVKKSMKKRTAKKAAPRR